MIFNEEDQNQLLCNHIGQVEKLAKKYHGVMMFYKNYYNYPCEYADLLQAGCIGLLKAISKYDVNHDSTATFNTYAFWWIRTEI
jgi:RNA polymerase sigma factor (sigma-70 family)